MTAEQTDVNAHAEAPSTFTPETPATGGDKEHLVPVMSIKEDDECKSIKFAVDYGNLHKQKAQSMGKAASDFI